MKIRKNTRAVLLNENNEIFLFKFHFAMLLDDRTMWVTPGGGIAEGESFEDGLKRELFEELGLSDIDIGSWIWFRNKPNTIKSGEQIMSEERYFLVRTTTDDTFTFEHMGYDERSLTKDGRWWSVEALEASSEEFFTERLFEKLQTIIDQEQDIRGGQSFADPEEI